MFPEVNRIQEFFFKNPTTSIHLRELARQTGFSPAGTKKALQKLTQQGFVIEHKNKAVINYKASMENPAWQPLKRVYNFCAIYTSGLSQFLQKEYDVPEAIIENYE